MKLSNKILIGFFGILFLYLTAVFAEVRFRGVPAVINDSNSISETVDISGVANLVLTDVEEVVNIIGVDHEARLEVRSINGDLLKNIKFTISGDTLRLSRPDIDDNVSIRISIYVPHQSLKHLNVQETFVFMEALEQDELHIIQDAGRITMSGNDIKALEIEVSNHGHLNFGGSEIESLSARLEEAEVLIYSPVEVLKGRMKNNSYLRLIRVDNIQFEKDATSSLLLY